MKKKFFGNTIVTEKNFESIMKQMKMITDKYMLIELYDFIKHDDNSKNNTSFKGINLVKHHFYKTIKKNGNVIGHKYKIKYKLLVNNIFMNVKKHRCRWVYENEALNQIDIKYYIKHKPLIACEIGSNIVIVLNKGSLITFLPFNIGFILHDKLPHLYNRDKGIKINPIHIHVYIINPFHKIDYFEEIKKRDNEAILLENQLREIEDDDDHYDEDFDWSEVDEDYD